MSLIFTYLLLFPTVYHCVYYAYARLEKLNDVVRKSQPLKPWTARSMGEVKARLDVELTARRTLSFLSGNSKTALAI